VRFAVAAFLGGGTVFVLAWAVLGSTVWQALAVTALFMSACVVVATVMRETYPHAFIGLCNLVTLARLVLTVSLVAPILDAGAAPVWGVFSLAVLALALDGVDGWFARRQGLSSAFGARFDMEVDAGLSLVVALNALAAGTAGPLVLLLGIPRYAFAVAGRVLPFLANPLPDRFGRKVACVLQIGALIALQRPILSEAQAGVAVGVATLALFWSFGRDAIWLYRRHA
jgi:phosphatidylglycerophosphate synthase